LEENETKKHTYPKKFPGTDLTTQQGRDGSKARQPTSIQKAEKLSVGGTGLKETERKHPAPAESYGRGDERLPGSNVYLRSRGSPGGKARGENTFESEKKCWPVRSESLSQSKI